MSHLAIKAVWVFGGIFSVLFLALTASILPDFKRLRREFLLYLYEPPTRMECLDATNPGWRDDLPKGRNPFPYFFLGCAMIVSLIIALTALANLP